MGERELRMQLLQSQGKEKANKNKNSKKGLEQLYGKSKAKEKRPPPKPRVESEAPGGPDEEKVAVNDDTDVKVGLDRLGSVEIKVKTEGEERKVENERSNQRK